MSSRSNLRTRRPAVRLKRTECDCGGTRYLDDYRDDGWPGSVRCSGCALHHKYTWPSPREVAKEKAEREKKINQRADAQDLLPIALGIIAEMDLVSTLKEPGLILSEDESMALKALLDICLMLVKD